MAYIGVGVGGGGPAVAYIGLGVGGGEQWRI